LLYSNILVPYDGSELALKALDNSIEFAKLDPTVKITVLHAVTIQSMTVHASLYTYLKIAKLENANETVEPVKVKLAKIPNSSEVLIREGSPSYVILQKAKETNCDLIIMGSRGLSGIKEFLGSVSHSITQQSSISVLLMK
jgi:nucleotide-binding universal stress UspA family protein